MPPGAFSPYADGRKAWSHGQPMGACLYPADRETWRVEWERGWRQAKMDAEKGGIDQQVTPGCRDVMQTSQEGFEATQQRISDLELVLRDVRSFLSDAIARIDYALQK